MSSNDLIKRGFQKFGIFSLLDFRNKDNKKIFNNTGVYVFVLGEKFNRLIGETDILYIGQSGGTKRGKGRPVYNRLIDYCIGSEKAPQDKRVHDSLERLIKAGKSVILFFKAVEKNNCEKEESDLLKQFSGKHIELPPLNRSHKIYK